MVGYVPARGDLVTLDFDPQAGHEQRGRRPALVVSHTLFNRKTGLAAACPITNTDRKSRLHVPLPEGCGLTGFVMVDQLKSVDHAARQARFVAAAPAALLEEVLAVLDAILFHDGG